MSTLPKDINWALSLNAEITPILLAKYPPSDNYWTYLNTLISDLRSLHCGGIQKKFVDVANNFSKFQSTISELEIARLLSKRGKQAELLQDSFMPTKSPDILVEDKRSFPFSKRKDYYVEVMRFSDDESSEIIMDGLRASVGRLSAPVWIDVTLPDDLSRPVTRYDEREIKENKAKSVIEQFNKQIDSINLAKLPVKIDIVGVRFDVLSSSGISGPRFITTSGIVVPSYKYVERIRYITKLKAEKRATWVGDHLKKKYIVAVDCEQVLLGEEDVDQAVLGSRETFEIGAPKPKIPSEVNDAARANWTGFLKKVHLIPTAKTIFTSYGVFLTDPICRNVSGILIRWAGVIGHAPYFVPNPFADPVINDSKLTTFV